MFQAEKERTVLVLTGKEEARTYKLWWCEIKIQFDGCAGLAVVSSILYARWMLRILLLG